MLKSSKRNKRTPRVSFSSHVEPLEPGSKEMKSAVEAGLQKCSFNFSFKTSLFVDAMKAAMMGTVWISELEFDTYIGHLSTDTRGNETHLKADVFAEKETDTQTVGVRENSKVFAV